MKINGQNMYELAMQVRKNKIAEARETSDYQKIINLIYHNALSGNTCTEWDKAMPYYVRYALQEDGFEFYGSYRDDSFTIYPVAPTEVTE